MADKFPQPVREALAARVAHVCSRPGCYAPTSGPHSDPGDFTDVGVAAHITAASPGGPRHDPTLTSEERRAATNGIWLCQVCAKRIDDDPDAYPVELLREWKRTAEETADRALGKPQPDDRQASLLGAQLAPILAHIQATGPTSPTALDAELEEVKQELDRNNVDLARRLVEKLIERAKNLFTPAQRWRAQALLAGTYLAQVEYARAGRLLVDAVAIQPDQEKARAHEAAGYGMLGDHCKAHQLAAAVLADYPDSAKALAVWIQTHPDPVQEEVLTSRAGALATSNEEVAVALAAKFVLASLPASAEPFARAATSLDPGSPHGWLLLAQSLHQQAVTGVRGESYRRRLAEAATHYDRAVELATRAGPRHLLVAAHTNRAIVRELTGDAVLADEDYREAVRLEPADGWAAARYSMFLARQSRADEAVRWAGKAVDLTPSPEHDFMLAAALYERDHGGDRARAVEKCRLLVTAGDPEFHERGLACAVMGLCQLGRPAEARALLEGVPQDAIPEGIRLTHLARISLDEGDRERAVVLARDAAARLGPDSPPAVRHALAHLMRLLDLGAEAIAVLVPATRPGCFDDATRLLLDLASRADRDDLTLRVCRELREAGVDDRRVVGQELDLLSAYDPRAGLELVRAFSAAHPEDRVARLRLALLEDQCEAPGSAPPALADLPSPAEGPPATVGIAVLKLLSRQSRWAEAVDFGYDLLRAYPDDPEANHAFISMMLHAEQAGMSIEAVDLVGPNSAVRFREVGHDRIDSLVIEARRPNPHLGELPPSHGRVIPMLGLCRGERFLLASGIQDRYGEVLDVLDKRVFRLQECMASYQTRFRDRHDLQAVQVVHREPDGTNRVDLSPIIKGLQGQERRVTEALDFYKSQPTPLHFLSTLLGRDLYETMDGLSWPGLGVRCWNGNEAEWAEAVTAFEAGRTLVLDSTALYSLARLGLLDRLNGARIVVTPSTFNDVRNLAIDHPLGRSRRSMVLLPNGRLAFVETPAEEATRGLQFRRTIADWVRARCEVVSCLELSALVPDRRHELVEMVGRSGAESASVAARAGHMLWTDDLFLAGIARVYCPGVQRTWTQPALHSLAEVGRLGSVECFRASAGLIGLEYGVLRIGPEILHQAATLAGWSAKATPFAQALRYFRRTEVGYADRLRMAAAFLCMTVDWEPTGFVRESILGATLSSMPKAMVKDLARVLSHAPEGSSTHEVHSRVVWWLARTTLIYPGFLR